MTPTTRSGARPLGSLVAVLIALLTLAGCTSDGTDGRDFVDLTAGQRIYDVTGDSLDDAETAELQQRLDTLEAQTGADVVAYVRELDVAPDDTLDQVEALQQAWVAATGVDQDIAGAILINREPGAADEARAGIFLGATFDDGNVPRGEQTAIVDDELIPPLRDGDVAGSLTAGIERLSSSIRNGPPTDAVQDFAAGPGSTWLPWVTLAVVLVGAIAVALIWSHRPRPTMPKATPTTIRPDRETPASLAGALVGGGPQASAVPAVILDLAARDALVIEPEKEPGSMSKGTVQVRLRDRTLLRADVEQVVWRGLVEHADGDLVDSKGLGKVAGGAKDVRQVLRSQLRQHGWLGEQASRPRGWLVAIGIAAVLLLTGTLVVTAGGSLLMLVAAIPAGMLAAAGIIASAVYSKLSIAGLDAARPWQAYRTGLKQAGKDETAPLDLDAVLPDVISFNLGNDLKKRLDAATDPATGTTLRAFTPPDGTAGAINPAIFPWGAFTGVFAASSGGTTVTAAGAGGGGGAAGST